MLNGFKVKSFTPFPLENPYFLRAKKNISNKKKLQPTSRLKKKIWIQPTFPISFCFLLTTKKLTKNNQKKKTTTKLKKSPAFSKSQLLQLALCALAPSLVLRRLRCWATAPRKGLRRFQLQQLRRRGELAQGQGGLLQTVLSPTDNRGKPNDGLVEAKEGVRSLGWGGSLSMIGYIRIYIPPKKCPVGYDIIIYNLIISFFLGFP